MRTLSDLLIEIPRYQSGGDVDVVRRAYEFTQEVHRGQLRVSGEPYDIHPLAVAGLLVEFKMDATTVAAGLLHDVLEDTATSKAVLEERFGGDIAELVDGVTKIGKLAFASREERQAENFRKMLVAMARDIRVLMIKLADRLHNMRTLHYLPPEKQRAIGAGDPRHLRAARAPARYGEGQGRAGGPGAQGAPSRGVRRPPATGGQASSRARGRDQPGHHDPVGEAGRGRESPDRSPAGRSTSTRSTRRCRRAGSSTRSTISPPCASSPPRCGSATASWGWSTRCGSRCPAGSRTSSRSRSRTCTSRSTRR